MYKPLFRRCFGLALLSGASLALSACGGSSADDQVSASEPQARSSTQDETYTADEVTIQLPFDLVAADAGAATQEPNR